MNLNRRKAIRERCLNCVGWIPSDVRKCDFTDCALHPFRMGTGKQDAADRAASIRKYCLQCTNDQPTEVRLCPCRDCSLYPYRHYKVDRSVEIKSESEKQHIEAILEENRKNFVSVHAPELIQSKTRVYGIFQKKQIVKNSLADAVWAP